MAYAPSTKKRACEGEGAHNYLSFMLAYLGAHQGPVSYTHLTLPTTTRV